MLIPAAVREDDRCRRAATSSARSASAADLVRRTARRWDDDEMPPPDWKAIVDPSGDHAGCVPAQRPVSRGRT